MIFDFKIRHRGTVVFEALNLCLHDFTDVTYGVSYRDVRRHLRTYDLTITFGARSVSLTLVATGGRWKREWRHELRPHGRWYQLRQGRGPKDYAWSCWARLVDDGLPSRSNSSSSTGTAQP